MKPADIELIKKINNYCHDIIELSVGVDFKTFSTNKAINYQCVFPLLQIGELATKLSDEYKVSSNIPWHAIVSIRHRIVHGYDGLDMKIIFSAITKNIPELKHDLDQMLMTFIKT